MLQLSFMQDTGDGKQMEDNKRKRDEILLKLAEEELKRKQRAKQHWLQHGDRNTKFYHMHASQHKKKNGIQSIVTSSGVLITNPKLIGDSFSDFFQHLFTSSHMNEMD